MYGLISVIILLFCLHGQVHATPGSSIKLTRAGNDDRFVFRNDKRSPKEIKEAGGFLPKHNRRGTLSYDDDGSYSLVSHVDFNRPTAFVSTTASFGVAARFSWAHSYVYRIRRTPNLIDTNRALHGTLEYQWHYWQHEQTALGGIPWNQIEGWWEVEEEVDKEVKQELERNQVDLDDDEKVSAVYNQKYEGHLRSRFIRNEDYKEPEETNAPDPQTGDMSKGTDTDLIKKMAKKKGSQEAAIEFMDRHGSLVGWIQGQGFPLWSSEPPTSSSNAVGPDPDELRSGALQQMDDDCGIPLSVLALWGDKPGSSKFRLKRRANGAKPRLLSDKQQDAVCPLETMFWSRNKGFKCHYISHKPTCALSRSGPFPRIDAMNITIRLSDDSFSGTENNLQAHFGENPSFTLLSETTVGARTVFSKPIKTMLGSSRTVRIDSISKLGLFLGVQEPRTTIKIASLVIVVQQADTKLRFQNIKHMNISQELDSSVGENDSLNFELAIEDWEAIFD
ncbi:ADP-ribosylation [Myriangium duriaei CBS 260.36]|uniref:ADP-ribosylation n=1 Tax=Myriangium duriaei CBS 260.36 TaxID=1168546 RepID=A0A9P4IS09_9PEZI|nr:ADP-ribosylation [Myriangium duriaei CBS 260.36]